MLSGDVFLIVSVESFGHTVSFRFKRLGDFVQFFFALIWGLCDHFLLPQLRGQILNYKISFTHHSLKTLVQGIPFKQPPRFKLLSHNLAKLLFDLTYFNCLLAHHISQLHDRLTRVLSFQLDNDIFQPLHSLLLLITWPTTKTITSLLTLLNELTNLQGQCLIIVDQLSLGILTLPQLLH